MAEQISSQRQGLSLTVVWALASAGHVIYKLELSLYFGIEKA